MEINNRSQHLSAVHADDQTPEIQVHHAAAAFAALGSEQRLGIMQSLVRAGPKGLAIGELGKRSSVTGSTLTHHLKILTAAGLVDQVKQGRSIVCAAVAYGTVARLSGFLLQNCCADVDGHSGQTDNA